MPTTLTGLLLLVVSLLPGITYVAIRERHTPEVRRSPFRETATVATVSIVANVAALGFFALVRTVGPGITPDIGELIRDTPAYLRENYASTALWAIGVLTLAMGIAALSALVASKRDPHPSTMSAWWMLFHHYHKRYYPTSRRHVGCFLEDGSWVEGLLASFNASSDDIADREIVLVGPIKYAFSGRDRAQPYPRRSVAISARRITAMFVTYLPPAEGEPPSPPPPEPPRALVSPEDSKMSTTPE